VEIRPATQDDRAAVYRICLLTGDAGGDATDQFADPDLLPDVYAGPYLELEPGLAFVAADDDGVLGYVLAARDTEAFERARDDAWFPRVRERRAHAPAPRGPFEAYVAGVVRGSERTPAELVAAYPSHLHIDLLPRAQRRGIGRALIERELDTLTEAGSTGVHLGVAPSNTGALAFYDSVGFERTDIAADPGVVRLCRSLPRG
jgi:ribosomal protein S18 acetylase RimI-like enzyme